MLSLKISDIFQFLKFSPRMSDDIASIARSVWQNKRKENLFKNSLQKCSHAKKRFFKAMLKI